MTTTDIPTEVNFASGGSGNDIIVGTLGGDKMFGGTGHDVLIGGSALIGTA